MVIGTMNNAGTVLLTIADMSVIQAEVDVDETDIPTLRIGQPAKVTIDAMPGKTFTGKVTEIGNSPIQAHRPAGQRRRRPTSRSSSRWTRRSQKCARASPAPRRSRRRYARTPSRFRFRPPRSARSSSTTRETWCGRRRRQAAAPSERRRRAGRGTEARPVAQGARRCIRRPGRQGAVHPRQDRYRRREILRGAVGAEGRRCGHHRPVRSVRELADGAAVKVTPATRDGQRNREPVLRSGGHRAERDLDEQAAIVPDRPRQHRRGHVHHCRRVARPGHERLRHRRDHHGRRRRQLHHSADARRPHGSGRGTRPQHPPDHARDAAAIQRYGDNIGAVAAQARAARPHRLSRGVARQRLSPGRVARLRELLDVQRGTGPPDQPDRGRSQPPGDRARVADSRSPLRPDGSSRKDRQDRRPPFPRCRRQREEGLVLRRVAGRVRDHPARHLQKMFGSRPGLQLMVKPKTPDVVKAAMDDATVALRIERRLRANEADNFGMFSSDTLLGLYNRRRRASSRCSSASWRCRSSSAESSS